MELSTSPRFHGAIPTRTRVASTGTSIPSSRPNYSSLSSRLKDEPKDFKDEMIQELELSSSGSIPRVGSARFKRTGSVHVFSETAAQHHDKKEIGPISVDTQFYGRLGQAVQDGKATLKDTFEIPPRDARSFTLPAGYLCRIVVSDRPQVGDLNLWSRANPREHLWASKTRQFHSAHIRQFDRLWSVSPFLRPMATVTGDSINYGIDADGAGCHDLLGARSDPYSNQLLTGEAFDYTSHSNLLRAVLPWHLMELDIHDSLGVFLLSGLTRDTHQYFTKKSPARKGDYFEFFAEIDLLCALSTNPEGDMAVQTPGPAPEAVEDFTLATCSSLRIEIYEVDKDLLSGWKPSIPVHYQQTHALYALPYQDRGLAGTGDTTKAGRRPQAPAHLGSFSEVLDEVDETGQSLSQENFLNQYYRHAQK